MMNMRDGDPSEEVGWMYLQVGMVKCLLRARVKNGTGRSILFFKMVWSRISPQVRQRHPLKDTAPVSSFTSSKISSTMKPMQRWHSIAWHREGKKTKGRGFLAPPFRLASYSHCTRSAGRT